MIDGPIIKKVLWDNLLDDLLQYLPPELLRRDFLRVLRGDDDSVDAQGDSRTTFLPVLDRDLDLRVGAEPWKEAGAASGGQRGIEFMSKHDCKRHVFGRFVGGVAEHNTLITGTVAFKGPVVEALGDIGGLLLDRDEDVAGLVVEAFRRVVIADVLDGIADDLLVIDLRFCADLAEDHDHARLGGRLAGDLGPGVLLKAGIELYIALDVY